MSINIASASAFAGTVIVSLLASAASAQSQATVKGGAKYLPIQNIRYDFGSKSTTGYFVEQAAKRIAMLMVYEKPDPDSDAPRSARVFAWCLAPGRPQASTATKAARSTSPAARGRRRCSSTLVSGKGLSKFKH